ncbi:MAG: HNH endonuclease signature motif containing protein [Leptolyngbyaceae cyanobacterium bins.302]|nr:HNH endonuclease signature motif containing protein [Leptolyngbyaceae cyanobacterium bins.302]
MRLADTPIQRHVKVKGTASPDDPSLWDYWQHRKTRYSKAYWDKGSKYYQVAQDWRCPVCNDPLFNGEALHTHHRVQLKEGGTDEEENLIHLHQACHHQVHQRGNALSDRWLEPLDGTTVTSGSEGRGTR